MDGRRSDDLQRHLEKCPACQVDLETARALGRSVRTAFERDPSLRVSPAFVSALSHELRARVGAPRRPRPWWRLPAAMLAAAAACLIVTVGVRGRVAAQRFNAVVADAVGDHENCAVHFRLDERPVAIAEAGRRFGPLFAALSTVEPRTASTEGMVVLSRHACVYRGRRFAHIEVRYEGVVGSVLVTGAPGLGVRRRDVFRRGEWSVVSVAWPDHALFVVCPLDEAKAREFADAFEQPVSEALAGL